MKWTNGLEKWLFAKIAHFVFLTAKGVEFLSFSEIIGFKEKNMEYTGLVQCKGLNRSDWVRASAIYMRIVQTDRQTWYIQSDMLTTESHLQSHGFYRILGNGILEGRILTSLITAVSERELLKSLQTPVFRSLFTIFLQADKLQLKWKYK